MLLTHTESTSAWVKLKRKKGYQEEYGKVVTSKGSEQTLWNICVQQTEVHNKQTRSNQIFIFVGVVILLNQVSNLFICVDVCVSRKL